MKKILILSHNADLINALEHMASENEVMRPDVVIIDNNTIDITHEEINIKAQQHDIDSFMQRMLNEALAISKIGCIDSTGVLKLICPKPTHQFIKSNSKPTRIPRVVRQYKPNKNPK